MIIVPPSATSLNDFKSRITTAVNLFDENTVRSVWGEFNYDLDVVRVAGRGHRENL